MSRRARRSRIGSAASSLPAQLTDITSGPGVVEGPTSIAWAQDASTNAPAIGEPDRDEKYSGSTPELAHRILTGKLPLHLTTVWLLLSLVWFLAAAWTFQQDNGSGKLQSWSGIGWFFVKAGVLAIAGVLAGGVAKIAYSTVGRGTGAT